MKKKIVYVDATNGFGKNNQNVMTYEEIVEQVAGHPFYSPNDTEHSDLYFFAYELKDDGTYKTLHTAYSVEEIAKMENIVLEAVE